MHRVFVVAMVLLLAASAGAGLVGCAAAEEFVECEVDLADVYPIFQGKESITYAVVFSIRNPGDVDACLDTLEYTLTAEGKTLAAAQVSDDVYVPAGETVRMTDARTVPLGGFIGELLFSGAAADPGTAMAMVLPLWKKLGAANPMDKVPPMVELWDKSPGPWPTFSAEGTAYTMATVGGEIERLDIAFTLSHRPE